jgi:hypothetical protein
VVRNPSASVSGNFTRSSGTEVGRRIAPSSPQGNLPSAVTSLCRQSDKVGFVQPAQNFFLAALKSLRATPAAARALHSHCRGRHRDHRVRGFLIRRHVATLSGSVHNPPTWNLLRRGSFFSNPRERGARREGAVVAGGQMENFIQTDDRIRRWLGQASRQLRATMQLPASPSRLGVVRAHASQRSWTTTAANMPAMSML